MPGGDVRLLALEEERLFQVVDSWRRHIPGSGVLALLPEGERRNLPLLQSACKRAGMVLAGGIFPALLTADGFVTQGVWLCRVEQMGRPLLLTVLEDAEAVAADMAAEIAGRLEAMPEAVTPTLLMLFDGLLPNIASLLDALYLHLADRVTYVGANAGSETFAPMPCLFDGERAVESGVLCMLLPERRDIALEHGYPAAPQVLTATSTSGNRIDRIDWRPAFEVYRERVREACGVSLSADNFYEYAVHFPLGILRADSSVVVRIPVGLGEDGAVYCVGEVPVNAILVLLQAPPGDAGTMTALGRRLLAGEGACAGSELLVFYCAGRRMHLGKEAGTEIRELLATVAPGTLAGALSLGEIGAASCHGYPLFHNAAVLALPWSRG